MGNNDPKNENSKIDSLLKKSYKKYFHDLAICSNWHHSWGWLWQLWRLWPQSQNRYYSFWLHRRRKRWGWQYWRLWWSGCKLRSYGKPSVWQTLPGKINIGIFKLHPLSQVCFILNYNTLESFVLILSPVRLFLCSKIPGPCIYILNSIHTCKNLIPMVVTRAMANSSKNHALLMCRIWKMGWNLFSSLDIRENSLFVLFPA